MPNIGGSLAGERSSGTECEDSSATCPKAQTGKQTANNKIDFFIDAVLSSGIILVSTKELNVAIQRRRVSSVMDFRHNVNIGVILALYS